jgi:hypothetical protein
MQGDYEDYEETINNVSSGIDSEAITDMRTQLLYEMISTIEDEIRDGSTLNNRYDSFAYFFEQLFDVKITDIDSIEEIIQEADDKDEKIEIYTTIRNEIANIYDKYFGITFDDIERVHLNDIYIIYITIYLGFIDLLCNYAAGKAVEKGIGPYKLFIDAQKENIDKATDIADYIVGNYIMNEDEFTGENLAAALEIADPGNEGYLYLFGNSSGEEGYKEGEIQEVFIDNEAFRRRIKKEYLNPAVKYLIELVFSRRVSIDHH